MKIHRGMPVGISRSVVTVGNFDGVHSGHRELISQLNSVADREFCDAVVVTFWPHPRRFFGGGGAVGGGDFRLLSTLDERLELLRGAGARHVVVVDFDAEFSSQSASEFVSDWLVGSMGCVGVVLGDGHFFGRGGCGVCYSDYGIVEYPLDRVGGISSSLVRVALECGELERAVEYLGCGFYVLGSVDLSLKLFPAGDVFLCEYGGEVCEFSRAEILSGELVGGIFLFKRVL